MTGKTGTEDVLFSSDGKTSMPKRKIGPTSDYCGVPLPETIRFGCGHDGPTFFAVEIYGNVHVLTQEAVERRGECAACLVKGILIESKRCCLCGKLIANKSLVAVYRDDGQFPAYATRLKVKGADCALGCSECAPSPRFFGGALLGGRFVTDEELARDVSSLFTRMLGAGCICEVCPAPDCPMRTAPYEGPPPGREPPAHG